MSSAEVRRRRGVDAKPRETSPGIHPAIFSPAELNLTRLASPSGSKPPTPRSTLGSPLTTHAYRRPGGADSAAGPRRRNSLSEVEFLPWLCCMAPAFCLFSLFSAVLVSSLFFPHFFYWLTAMLTFVSMLWITNMAFASLLGAYYLRQGSKTDFHSQLMTLPEEDTAGVMHIVLLPNFMEHEAMLKETLENLGLSPLARSTCRVVLAMEAREGAGAHEKAQRLIDQTKHLFADIFATYHPKSLPGEVAGKSSNTQWAFREALRHYGQILDRHDLSRVFLTVGDADTLFHPQYLSAVTYQGMIMKAEERCWRIWQSPILLLRNISSVPSMTRVSAHCTLIFELSALANQYIFPAFAYSAYSLTLALASHPEVDGWDVDVIAEDHHMFCKCFFASIWESAHASQEIKKASKREHEIKITSKVEVQPVYLPSVSYLVESSDGYFASLWARFQQARRHSQGVIELGYVLLQYARLIRNLGFFGIPGRTHAVIISIAVKMHTLHITATAQCFALIMATATTFLPKAVDWLLAGGMSRLFETSAGGLYTQVLQQWWGLDSAQQALGASMGNLSWVIVLYSISCFVVICDVLEGWYYQKSACISSKSSQKSALGSVVERTEEEEEKRGPSEPLVSERRQGALFPPAFVLGPRSWLWKASLLLEILHDTALVGYATTLFFAVIPVLLAGWSLFRRGTDFEYIVAMKPE